MFVVDTVVKFPEKVVDVLARKYNKSRSSIHRVRSVGKLLNDRTSNGEWTKKALARTTGHSIDKLFVLACPLSSEVSGVLIPAFPPPIMATRGNLHDHIRIFYRC
mgnify:CR=1 FL=1